jgi:hypothetical protein
MAARPNGKISTILAVIPVAAIFLAAHAARAQTNANGPAGSPTILLPDRLRTGSQQADAPIDIRFVTAPDTAVDLSSLHIWVRKTLGWIDVTDRLRTNPQVHVNVWGIHLDGGVLPVGEHQVRLAFHDMKGRAADATQTIRILRTGSPI